MDLIAASFLLSLILSASIMLTLGLYCRRYTKSAAALPYQILMFGAAYWALNYALDLSTTALPLKVFWQEIRFLVNPFFPVIEIWLVLAFLSRTEMISGWKWKSMLIIPIITALTAITSQYHTLFRYDYVVDLSGPLPVLHFSTGPCYLLFILYSHLIIVGSLFLLMFLHEGTHQIFKSQRLLLLCAIAFPSIIDLLFQVGITPIPGVNPAPALLWISGIIYVVALFRYDFLDLVPIARSRVIEGMGMPMMVLNTDGRVVDMNQAAGLLLHDPDLSGVGRKITSLARDWPEFTSFCLSEGHGQKEIKFTDAGKIRIFSGKIDPLISASGETEGRIIVLTDITEQKNLQQSIQESEQRWRSIVDGAPFPIVIIRLSDNTIILVNRRTLEQFNVEYDDLIGKTTLGYYADLSARDRVLAHLIEYGYFDDLEMEMRSGTGRIFWVYASGRKIQYQGEDALFISFADFTERKSLEHALLERNRDLDLLTVSLAETNKKLNLLSNITRHDILNQVQVISCLTDLISMGIESPDILQKITMIEQADMTIRSLIEFTGVYQDLGQTAPVWQNLSEVLVTLLQSGVPDTISISTPDIEVEIFADPLFKTVFYNLVENSIRHGGSVTSVIISADTNGEELTLKYEDDGGGIPDDDKSLIFNRGYGKNTGLGLFFIREILGITGMEIVEDGVYGKGVRFLIHVPSGKFRILPTQ